MTISTIKKGLDRISYDLDELTEKLNLQTINNKNVKLQSLITL
jgi:hypothetical protein